MQYTPESLHIYTEQSCAISRVKAFIKNLIDSLVRGLRELDMQVAIDKKPAEPIDVACVLSGTCALQRVIEWKRKGLVKKIVAGPNIVVFPDDVQDIMRDDAIDVIVVPAQWVKDLWVSLRPELAPRIAVWAAGVQDPGEVPQGARSGLLIYKKHAPKYIFDAVVRHLADTHIPYVVLEYGSFDQRDYFALLETVSGMIYLTESESQGLALAEAWIRGVPTLVWDRGLFTGGGREWSGASSAPYLVDACGMRFKGAEDLAVLSDFMASLGSFRTRAYALEHFTDRKSAERYLSIISQ